MSPVLWRDEMNRWISAERGRAKDSIRNKGVILSRQNQSRYRNPFKHMASADPLIIVGRVEKSSIGSGISIIERAQTPNG